MCPGIMDTAAMHAATSSGLACSNSRCEQLQVPPVQQLTYDAHLVYLAAVPLISQASLNSQCNAVLILVAIAAPPYTGHPALDEQHRLCTVCVLCRFYTNYL
jgi:hypothetical protein